MKKIILFFILFLLAFPLFAQFRGYTWGTSPDTIIEAEGKPTEEKYEPEEIRSIEYQNETVLGVSGRISYIFYYDKLVVGMYGFNTSSVAHELKQILFDQYPTTKAYYSSDVTYGKEIHKWRNLNQDDFKGAIEMHIFYNEDVIILFYMSHFWRNMLDAQEKQNF